jgi:nucleoside-diphosphate-sugar epimerase
MMTHTLFLLGASGFIGGEVLREAIAQGWQVKALMRSPNKAVGLDDAGVHIVPGDAQQPQLWIDRARGAAALVDLVQPRLPARITQAAIREVAAYRQTVTSRLLASLQTLRAEDRPLLFHVSGADDLQPDADNGLTDESPLRTQPRGFGHIGIPVRRLVEASGLDALYLYFGNIVYGPGKVYEDVIVKGLREGKARVIGSGDNHLPLTHVKDAARAVVHLAAQSRAEVRGRTFIATDGSDVTQRDLYDVTADEMGVRRAGSSPAWLAGLVAGQIAVETMTLDVQASHVALFRTGFEFIYPSIRTGVPATLDMLRLRGAAVQDPVRRDTK